MAPPLATSVCGLVLYSITEGITLTALAWSIFLESQNTKGTSPKKWYRPTIQKVFHGFLSLFLAARLAWLCLEAFSRDELPSFILNRIAFSTFFTSFTLVLFYWVETYHKTYISTSNLTEGFLPRMKWAFIILNAVTYLIQLISVILFFLKNSGIREENPIYEANIIFDAALFFIVALGFFFYGFRLFCKTRRRLADSLVDMKRIELCRVFVVTVIFTACFMLRVVMFSYRSITQQYIDEVAFYVLAYYLPEMVPSLLQIYIVHASRRKEESDLEYIEQLYKEEEDDAHDPRSESDYDGSLAFSGRRLDGLSTSSGSWQGATAAQHETTPLFVTQSPHYSPLML